MADALVLGIDAAWTATNPSGVALIERTGGVWRLRTVQQSYCHFLAWSVGKTVSKPPRGCRPNVAGLLSACGGRPAMIAVDMPLSRETIVGRRVSDNALSRAYAARGAGTHSPSATRPGPIADSLRQDLEHEGYTLWTALGDARPGFAEVYPHPALIALTGSARRLPYKRSKTLAYWPDRNRADREAALLAVWAEIVARLDARIAGVRDALPLDRSSKATEDMLDAVICAWIGACMLEGRAMAYGDATSAIWVPHL